MDSVYYNPPNFLFLPIEKGETEEPNSFLSCEDMGVTPLVADWIAILWFPPNKHIFAEKTPGCLFQVKISFSFLLLMAQKLLLNKLKTMDSGLFHVFLFCICSD